MTAFNIPDEAREVLNRLVAAGGQSLPQFYTENKNRVRACCERAVRTRGMMAVAPAFNGMVEFAVSGSVAPSIWRRALLARFALDLPQTASEAALPHSILAQYPGLLSRLAVTIESFSDDVDSYTRDVAHALGLFLPAAAQDIDINSHISPRMIASSALRRSDITPLRRYVAESLWRRAYDVHTDSRDTSQFNPDGWLKTYKCIADLMRLRPEVGAFFGTSWFYDPALIEISPRLAYLQEIPRSGGAFFIWCGTGPLDIQRATRTSETRRRLFEEGRYIPTCYTMIWPRAALLKWASSELELSSGLVVGRRRASGVPSPGVANDDI